MQVAHIVNVACTDPSAIINFLYGLDLLGFTTDWLSTSGSIVLVMWIIAYLTLKV